MLWIKWFPLKNVCIYYWFQKWFATDQKEYVAVTLGFTELLVVSLVQGTAVLPTGV